jgi:hypothetical protein
VVTVPAPHVSITFSGMAEALNQQDVERRAREAKMRNALEIIADARVTIPTDLDRFPDFARRVAREGLGRE